MRTFFLMFPHVLYCGARINITPEIKKYGNRTIYVLFNVLILVANKMVATSAIFYFLVIYSYCTKAPSNNYNNKLD